MKVAVVGAGIMGTSCATLIQETYPHDVEVVQIAKEFSPHTTSDGAAGLWEPFCVSGTPEHLVVKWSEITYNWALDVQKTDSMSALCGLSITQGFNLTTEPTIETPFWSHVPLDFSHLTERELQRFPPNVRAGFKYTTVFIEASKLIPRLRAKFESCGGVCERRGIDSYEDIGDDFDVVVNCTGLGAKTLCSDPHMMPIRGQVRRVRAPWIKEFIIFDNTETDTVTYVLPNQDSVVLGGTLYKNDTNTEVEPEDVAHIVTTCSQLFPRWVQ